MSDVKILMVDDDAEDRTMMLEALADIGQADIVHYFEDGEQALAWLDGRPALQLPCLIVLDLNMPLMNGTEVLRQLKADTRLHSIPVIIYSTSVNALEKEACLSLGARAYITKPLSYQECLEIARDFLRVCEQN